MEALKCIVCFQEFNNIERSAVVLPCGHTFCSFCAQHSNDKCPTCKKSFHNNQVTKNFIVHAFLDELKNANHIRTNQETCDSHKREIDRVCKSCMKLMCSVCKCPHMGNEEIIVSDAIFREEIQRIFGFYEDIHVKERKQDFEEKINNFLKSQKSEIETSELSIIENDRESQLQEIDEEEKAAIEDVSEEARRQIQEIKEKETRDINRAKETAAIKREEIEYQTETRTKDLYSRIEIIENETEELKQKVDNLQDLTQLKKDSLNDCLKIYRLEEIQRAKLDEFLALGSCKLESLLMAPKKFQLGEEDEWLDANSPRFLKQWKPENEFQLNNRIEVHHKQGWLEARVIDVNSQLGSILVRFIELGEKYDEWIPKYSDRIAEVGTHSRLKNGRQ